MKEKKTLLNKCLKGSIKKRRKGSFFPEGLKWKLIKVLLYLTLRRIASLPDFQVFVRMNYQKKN